MIEDKIINAFKNDIHLDFYNHEAHMANKNRENTVAAGEDLPLPGTDNSSKELAGQIEGLYDFVWSVGLLCVLIAIREWMTPDILHFITDLKEE